MPIRFAGRAIKKVVSVVGAIAGVSTGSLLGIGGSLTGDLILDVTLILICTALILINGKDGIPDWIVTLTKERIAGDKNEADK